jgi:glycosyltransferase involved in cell wall biosynthesis
VRSEKLVQYLPDFGWDAAVICREERLPGGTRERAEVHPRVKRIPTPVPPRISYQLGAWIWAGRVVAGARRLLSDAQPRVIYASCPPFPHALSAIRMGRRAGIPVVVDFRDSWSLDPHLSGNAVKKAAKRALCGWAYPHLERKVIESADAIVMNTPSMRCEYLRRFPDAASRIHLVPNGFDESDFNGVARPPARSRPSLLYCGRFSGVAGRSPEVLLRAMRMVVDAGHDVGLEILGDNSVELRRTVSEMALEEWVDLQGTVSNREAVRAVCEADILVVYQAPSRNNVTPIAGKTYEYLRSGRPILAIVPCGDNADLVSRHAAVHALVTDESPVRVAAAIRELLDRNAAEAPSAPDPEFVERYSRRKIAERIAAIFDAACGQRKPAQN